MSTRPRILTILHQFLQTLSPPPRMFLRFPSLALFSSLPLDEVSGAVAGFTGVVEDAEGGETVAPGAAGFLVVVLEGLREGPVDDEADVGFVDAHAEGGGGDDDVVAGRVGEPGICSVGFFLLGEAGVVGSVVALAQVIPGVYSCRGCMPCADSARAEFFGDVFTGLSLLVLGLSMTVGWGGHLLTVHQPTHRCVSPAPVLRPFPATTVHTL